MYCCAMTFNILNAGENFAGPASVSPAAACVKVLPNADISAGRRRLFLLNLARFPCCEPPDATFRRRLASAA